MTSSRLIALLSLGVSVGFLLGVLFMRLTPTHPDYLSPDFHPHLCEPPPACPEGEWCRLRPDCSVEVIPRR